MSIIFFSNIKIKFIVFSNIKERKKNNETWVFLFFLFFLFF